MTTNMGTIDRILRMAAGAALIAWAAAMGGPVWAWIGVVSLATGLIRFCPIYPILGLNTRGKRD